MRPVPPAHPATARGLIVDTRGRWLIVRPIGEHDHWHLPGGLIEQDEPPAAACRRELREELGVDLVPGPLHVLGWNPPRQPGRRARFTFVFHMGTHDPRTLASAISLHPGELAEWRWATPHDARPMLHPDTAERLLIARDATATTVYVESGAGAGAPTR